ncbi:glutathione S-transferase 1-like [Dermacentor albipictus]|uniref:glutathione S-transferase 1-like n=1 Tax=Dermacentor albipictus TaxID=60249 RepID=UPI0038FBECC4
MTITLYNLDRSPPCMFVRSLAKHIGVALKIKDVDFDKKEHLTDEYFKINPFRKAPVIVDGDFSVYESNAIAYYLLRKHAPESELYPAGLKIRTRIDQVLAGLANKIDGPLVLFFFHRIVRKTKPSAEELQEFEQKVITGIEYLVGDDKFAAGDTLTLADLAVIPYLTLALENDSVDPAKFPKLASYYKRVRKELPYYEEIRSDGMKYFKELWATLK